LLQKQFRRKFVISIDPMQRFCEISLSSSDLRPTLLHGRRAGAAKQALSSVRRCLNRLAAPTDIHDAGLLATAKNERPASPCECPRTASSAARSLPSHDRPPPCLPCRCLRPIERCCVDQFASVTAGRLDQKKSKFLNGCAAPEPGFS